jgi:(p)ppGpp synthase/HD superfamily hydrolase
MEILTAHQELPFQRPVLAVQCALLHDTLEDTETSKSELLAIFGQEVTSGVLALTKNPSVPSGERMADSVHRIRLQPSEVWAVKMADRIANLGPPPQHWSTDKIASYRTEAQFILEALREAHAPLSARLAMRIAEYPPNVATRPE